MLILSCTLFTSCIYSAFFSRNYQGSCAQQSTLPYATSKPLFICRILFLQAAFTLSHSSARIPQPPSYKTSFPLFPPWKHWMQISVHLTGKKRPRTQKQIMLPRFHGCHQCDSLFTAVIITSVFPLLFFRIQMYHVQFSYQILQSVWFYTHIYSHKKQNCEAPA